MSGHPEVMGEYPVGALAEEITTPCAGQLRALVTLAGNPVLSTPNSNQLAGALDELEFMVSIDLYLNETTRHADYILPSTTQLEHSNYDFLFSAFAHRNFARYSPKVFEPDGGGQPFLDGGAATVFVLAGAGSIGNRKDADAEWGIHAAIVQATLRTDGYH